MLPHVLGTPEQFTALREALVHLGYTAQAVAERTGVPSVCNFRAIREGRTVGLDLADPLDVLIRVFMDAEMVEWAVVRRRIPPAALAAMEALGLVQTARSSPAHCHATVLLYPTEWLYITSDLNADPDRAAPEASPLDVVYPAITMNTVRFMSYQPWTPCENFLELCSGTGIAALAAARLARHAWAVDITARATHFAEFNARLNGLTNVTAVQGDLYAPVEGIKFDRIAVHPPYVPARENKYIFRDGGEDGEQITRAAIAGLANHLAPGGRFYCTCLATDRKGMPLEGRVREMLGERRDEFDVLLITMQEFPPLEYYARAAAQGRGTFAEVGEWHKLFTRLQIERLVYGTIVVQRHTSTRPAYTGRRQVCPVISPAEADWLLSWEVAALDPDMSRRLLDFRPRAASRANLNLVLRQRDAVWTPEECSVAVHSPFVLAVECPVWVAALLAACDGATTVREHLAFFRGNGALPPGAPDQDFLGIVKALISGGILEIPEFPLPPAAPVAGQ